jgi:hypothetical protein
MSSSKTTTTFGAPLGAFTSKRGGGLTFRASSSVMVGGLGSGTGSTVLSICCAANDNGAKVHIVSSKCVTGKFFISISDFIVVVRFGFTSLSQNWRNSLAWLRADQCSSQLFEFLRVTEQGEQGNNGNEVAGCRYLEFRLSHNEDKAKNRGSQYEGHTADK